MWYPLLFCLFQVISNIQIKLAKQFMKVIFIFHKLNDIDLIISIYNDIELNFIELYIFYDWCINMLLNVRCSFNI